MKKRKTSKRQYVLLFLLNLVICFSTLAYLGMPRSLPELLMRIGQTVVAALSGAAMYGCLAAQWSIESFEQTIDSLQHGHTIR